MNSYNAHNNIQAEHKKHNMFLSMSNARKADIRSTITHVKMQKLSLKRYIHIKKYKTRSFVLDAFLWGNFCRAHLE